MFRAKHRTLRRGGCYLTPRPQRDAVEACSNFRVCEGEAGGKTRKDFETATRSQARPCRPPFGRRESEENAFLLSAKHPPQPQRTALRCGLQQLPFLRGCEQYQNFASKGGYPAT